MQTLRDIALSIFMIAMGIVAVVVSVFGGISYLFSVLEDRFGQEGAFAILVAFFVVVVLFVQQFLSQRHQRTTAENFADMLATDAEIDRYRQTTKKQELVNQGHEIKADASIRVLNEKALQGYMDSIIKPMIQAQQKQLTDMQREYEDRLKEAQRKAKELDEEAYYFEEDEASEPRTRPAMTAEEFRKWRAKQQEEEGNYY